MKPLVSFIFFLLFCLSPCFLIAQEDDLDDSDDVYITAHEMPRFPGCGDEKVTFEETTQCAVAFLQKNLRYPKAAKKGEVEGEVIISFIVDKEGKIKDALVLQEIGSGCGKEGLRLVSLMQDWIPGKHDGEPVQVQVNLPIQFELKQKSTPKPPKVATDEVTTKVQVFTVVEEMPRFPGCEDLEGTVEEKKECAEEKLLNFIYENVQYPEEARIGGIEGMVVVNFVIDKDGKILNPKILRDLEGGCGAESIRVVNLMPNWIPGTQGGKPVKVQFNLPIRFKLSAVPPAEELVLDSVPVHEELTPELLQRLQPNYQGLQYLFCGDSFGEIATADELNKIADTPVNKDNLCGFFFAMSNLKVSYEFQEKTKTIESESGEVTEEIRDLFRNAKPGSAFNFKFTVQREEKSGEIEKVLIVN